MYIYRHAEKTVRKMSKMFSAVLVSGARQVGKTTMLQKISEGYNYVSLDDPMLLSSAKEESSTFFKDNQTPIFIDEIQKAPSLFPYIKLIIDRKKEKGLFFLSGSQQFHLMKDVSESLSGRIGILNLGGLSMREKYGVLNDAPFIPTEDYIAQRKNDILNADYDDIWFNIWRGSMPELYANPDFDWTLFYSSYVSTYIERDIRALTQVQDELKFLHFMQVIASRTASMVNLRSIATDVGISESTADRWLSILVSSNIVYLLTPYYNNITSRALKTPKLYFLDTGLAAYLTKWTNADVLKTGAMSGAFFETFVVSEIVKSYLNLGIEPPLYFYRDKDKREIDLIIVNSGTLYPVEIKKHAEAKKDDIKHFKVIDGIPGVKRGPGCVICTYDRVMTLSGDDKVIPISYI